MAEIPRASSLGRRRPNGRTISGVKAFLSGLLSSNGRRHCIRIAPLGTTPPQGKSGRVVNGVDASSALN